MILDKIVSDKLEELEQTQQLVPLSALKKEIKERFLPLNLTSALSGNGVSLIAEIKKASPSKGVLRADLDPVKMAAAYATSGAAAVSVLTESSYFRGSLDDLEAVRHRLPDTPLLRKDFIVKPYQVYESRAWGADALLLIMAILTDDEFDELLSLSYDLGMQCLVEVHNEAELERALQKQVKIIGINNRDLTTMTVDINTTAKLRPLIPGGLIVVSESGIKERGDIERLESWGVDAVLIGEALVTAADTGAKIKELF